MIRILLLLSILVPMAPAQQTLNTFANTNRILLVFAPGENDPRYQQQLTLLAQHSAEMKDRDFLLLPVPLQSGALAIPETLRLRLGPRLSDGETTSARHRFHIASTDFAAVLIGKDGGEKFRSHQPVSIELLKQLIDAMPMRQDEMRRTRNSQ